MTSSRRGGRDLPSAFPRGLPGAASPGGGLRAPRAPVPRLAALLSLLLASPGGSAAPPRARLEPGFGVTPGGLVWTVEPSARRLVLRDLGGSERGAYPLAADEGHVLGATDTGARVTAQTPDGLRRRAARAGGERTVAARYVFRLADGSVRGTVETSALRGSEPFVLGEEVLLVRAEAGLLRFARVAPEGETLLAELSEADVRAAVGRPAPPLVFAGTGGAAALLPGARRDAAVRLDHPGTLYLPDPLEACGEGRVRLVLPHPDGILSVSVRTAPAADEEDRSSPFAVAEVFDEAGRLVRSRPLGPWTDLFPLPDGGLLGLDGTQAVRFDDQLLEVSRAILPLEEGADPAVATRIVEQVRRLERLGPGATGADWAELALLPGGPAASFVTHARRDPAGVLARLAAVPDGSPATLQASRAVALLADLLPEEERTAFRSRLREIAERGGLDWLRRAAAFVLLAKGGEEAPDWALPSVAEAVASGVAGDSYSLRDEAFTVELAELVTAVDRARIERIAREREDLAEALLAGSLDDALSSSFEELRFHAPARLFPATLLACAAGPPSLAGLLAATRVAEAVVESAPSLSGPDGDDAGGAPEVRGELAATVLAAQSAPDPGLRATAHALGPLAGFPLDAGRFRADVLRRPHLAALAFLGLVSDRSLTERAWQGLFTELFLDARSSSPDPAACAVSGWPLLQAEGDGSRDRYCNIFAIVHFVALELGDDEAPAFISRGRVAALGDFARSASAPPELKLELKLSHALRGSAPEEDVLEILGERELAPALRRIVIGKLGPGSPRLAAWLERELASGRVPAAERGAWLDALVRLDAAAGDRVAADAWTRGSVPFDEAPGEAGAFCRALSEERVRGSEPLRAALRRALGAPAVRVEAATQLARVADPGSAGALSEAILGDCPACLPPERLASLFGPLGEEGLDALEHLARETLPFGVAPLAALFELDAPRAEELGRASLLSALERGCVPERLLPVLLAGGLDPFPDLLAALETRGCDRARLRPGEPVAVGIARPAGTDTGRRARLALDSASTPLCRRALATLLGIPEDDGAAPE